jgi:hypothetical protein
VRVAECGIQGPHPVLASGGGRGFRGDLTFPRRRILEPGRGHLGLLGWLRR